MKTFKSLSLVFSCLLIFTFSTEAQNINNSIFPSEKNYQYLEEPPANPPRFIEHIAFTLERIHGMEVTVPDAPTDLPFSNTKSGLLGMIELASPLQFKYAMLMDVAVESVKQTALYQVIDDWYGTRYRMGGTTKKGIDCSAFTGYLLLTCYALKLPRTAREQHAISEPIEKEELEEGDWYFSTPGEVFRMSVYIYLTIASYILLLVRAL